MYDSTENLSVRTPRRRATDLLLIALLLTLCGLATARDIEFETAAGRWEEIPGKDGQKILFGKGHADGKGGYIHPSMEFTNVPDGPVAFQFDTAANECYIATSFLLRGPALGEGMIVMFHGNGTWRAFRNNLGPGHIEEGTYHPDNQSHNPFNSTIYDTTTVTATIYEDYPDLLDAKHPHSKKQEWWTVKVQLGNGRLMARAWLAGLQEPGEWHLDFPVEIDDSGPVGIHVNDPGRLRNIQRIPFEAPEFPIFDMDHRGARFGPPLEDYVIDVDVEEWPTSVDLRSDLTNLSFDRSRCAIRRVRMRQETFPVGCFPDLRITDDKGREFSQRHAIDGDLELLANRGAWIDLAGRCTLRTSDGTNFAHPIHFRYRVHRQSGLIHVSARPEKNFERAKIRRMALVHELADTPDQDVNDCQFVSPEHFFGLGNRAITHASHEDGVLHASALALGTWGNARYAFQVTPRSYALCSFDEKIANNPHGYHHLAIGTRGGHRYLDMVFVHHENTVHTPPAGAAYESTFSFLPWRRHRPRIELKASSNVCGDPTITCVSVEQPRLRALAEMGVTMHCHGYPPMGLLARHSEQARVERQLKQTHYFGMKDMIAWVLGTNWIGSWGRFPNRAPFEAGWLTEDEAFRARRLQPLRKGQTRGDDPKIPRELCVNDEVTRRLFVDRITMPAIDRFSSSSVYWDWTWSIYYCDNDDHGDATTSLTPLGHLALIDRFRRESRKRASRPTVMGCTYDAHSTPVSLIDFFNPGEAGKGWYLPNRAEHNLIYSSLLYGTQCIYHTSGGIALDSPRVYEQALAHCSTVMLDETARNAPKSDPAGTPGGFNEREHAMWMRYMTPLTIFDVNRSSYRHPYDADYRHFGSSTEGSTAVLYYRDGRAMIVFVKNSDEVHEGTVTVKPRALGIDGDRLLVYDVIDQRTSLRTTLDGSLTIPNVKLRKGPRFFVVQALPREAIPIWYSPSTWNARLHGEGASRTLDLRGVPDATLTVYVWCPAGPPDQITSGALENFDADSGIATIRTWADADARAEVELHFHR